MRRVRSGTRIERFEPISTPGIEPIRSHLIACRSTFAVEQVAGTGDPQKECGVQEVGADDARRREREEEQQRQPEEGARAYGGEADDEAEGRADQDCDHLHPKRDLERAVDRRGRMKVLARNPEATEDQRDPDDLPHGRGGGVGEGACELHADERSRPGADEHPEGESRVDVAELAMANGAERLEDRAVDDVRADGGLRVEAEDRGSASASSASRRPCRSSRRARRPRGRR